MVASSAAAGRRGQDSPARCLGVSVALSVRCATRSGMAAIRFVFKPPPMRTGGLAGASPDPERRVRFSCRALSPVAELFDVCLPGDRLAPVPSGDAACAFIDAFKEPTVPLDFLSLRLGG